MKGKINNMNKKYDNWIKAYKDYQRGIISLDEFYVIEQEINNDNYDLLLEEKLENELNTFRENLKSKTPEEIIDKAYELTVKEEIKEGLKNMNLHKKK